MKYRELLEFAKNYLQEHQIADYNTDASLLLEYVFGINKTNYFMKMNDDVCDEAKIQQYKDCLSIRASGRPLQYITGTQEFMGLTFKVNESVLIPRYDTEILVEKVLEKINAYNKDAIKLMDMCTGSGCIGISLARLGKITDVTCVDISKEALAVAKENALANDVSYIEFINSDLFTGIQNVEKYDFIISNPPYIKSEEIENLMREVKSHEPRLALDGDEDGLKFYNKITKEAVDYLHEGGWLMYEIGYDQGVEVSDLLKENGFADIEVIKDLAGLDRVVIGRKV